MTNERVKIKIPRLAMLQLYYIRDTGEVNMFEVNNVLNIVKRHKFSELEKWIKDIGEYAYNAAILYGVEEIKADIEPETEIKKNPKDVNWDAISKRLKENEDKKMRNYFTDGDETAADKDRRMRDYFSD